MFTAKAILEQCVFDHVMLPIMTIKAIRWLS